MSSVITVVLFLFFYLVGAFCSWQSWEGWNACSVTCGNGVRYRLRMCSGTSWGCTCSGYGFQSESCINGNCPINGNWGSWGSWSICFQMCGTGSKSRSRMCNNPTPNSGGSYCVGSSSDTADCNTPPCAQHGGWGQWTSLISCSSTCNGGISVSVRQCNSPSPANGGQYCVGNYSLISTCNTNPCPINGLWSPWSNWTNCETTSTGRYENRSRECTNPEPAYGGKYCEDLSTETRPCAEYIAGDKNEMTNYSSPAVVTGVAVSCIVLTLVCGIVFITARNRLSANGVKEKKLLTNNVRKHQGPSFDNAEYMGQDNMEMSSENPKPDGSCVYENLKF